MLNSAELLQRGHGTLSFSAHFKLFEMFPILDAFVKCRMGVWGSPRGGGLSGALGFSHDSPLLAFQISDVGHVCPQLL